MLAVNALRINSAHPTSVCVWARRLQQCGKLVAPPPRPVTARRTRAGRTFLGWCTRQRSSWAGPAASRHLRVPRGSNSSGSRHAAYAAGHDHHMPPASPAHVHPNSTRARQHPCIWCAVEESARQSWAVSTTFGATQRRRRHKHPFFSPHARVTRGPGVRRPPSWLRLTSPNPARNAHAHLRTAHNTMREMFTVQCDALATPPLLHPG